MSSANTSLTDFARLRDHLDSVLAAEAEIFQLLSVPQRASELETARRNLIEDRFRVVVMGAMKHGKSTLLNAMLGVELLPWKQGTACTAVPITIRFGEQARALCHRHHPEPPLECELPRDAQRFWKAVTLPPRDECPADDDGWAMRMHPYLRADVFAPIGLLRDGVELQDSPGLNEHSSRSETTWAQVERSDAVVLVLDAERIDTESDRECMKSLWSAQRDPRTIFVLWNKIDRYYDSADEARTREELARFAREAHAATEAMGFHRDRVWLVSAKDALSGRVKNDDAVLASSGLPEFESALGRFLVNNERSVAKLLTPLNVAEHAAGEALQVMLTRQADEWLGPVHRLGVLVERSRDLLRRAQRDRGRLTLKLEHAADSFGRSVLTAARAFVDDQCGAADNVIKEVEISALDAIFESKRSVERIAAAVETQLKRNAAEWEQKRLLPLVEEYGSAVRLHVTETMDELKGIIDDIADLEREATSPNEQTLRRDESGESAIGLSVDTDGLIIRISSIIGGKLSEDSPLGGVGIGALLGGFAGVWLAIIFTLPFLLAFLPAVVIGMLLGGRGAAGALKSRTAVAIRKAMLERVPDLEAGLLARISDGYGQIGSAVHESIDNALNGISGSVEIIESRHAEEKRLAAERKALLEPLRERLKDHKIALAKLRHEIDLMYTPRLASPSEAENGIERGSPPSEFPSSPGANDGHPRLPSVLVEVKAKLGSDGWDRLQAVKQYLEKSPAWKPRMEADIAGIWADLADSSTTGAAQQTAVYWTATALAVSRGESGPPTPKMVRKMYRDERDMIEMARLYILVTGDEDGLSYFADTDGKPGTAQERFVKAYSHAYNKCTAGPNDGAMRPGTIVDAVWERDPYRPVE